jgi:septal ring factor EnvC (AmiA/AmiB activator)
MTARGGSAASRVPAASARRGAARVWRRAAARLAAASGLALAAAAAAPQEPPPELAEVRRRVAALEAELRGLERRQEEVGRERQRIDTELALAAMKVKESEAELAAAGAAERAAAAAAEAAQERLRSAADSLRAQLGLLAVFGRVGLMPVVLHAVAAEDDVRRRITVTLAVVSEHRRRRDEIASLVEARTAALGELSRRREDVAAGRRELEARRRGLEATRARALAELARLERERRSGALALADAREAEGRLERLWGSVSPGLVAGPADIRLLRGALPWPAGPARVVRPFGERRDPRYGTKTVSNGVVLTVPAGEEVRAVAKGTVVFAQFFKGYGNLVIVDHGADVYSLYAQLASMFARKGQRVAMGEAVGVAGRSEDEGGNLYLEIRVGQRPQNPLAWLKPAGK